MNAMPPPPGGPAATGVELINLRLAVLGQGWSPIPVTSPDFVHHKCKSPGKAPFFKGWQTLTRETITPEAVRSWRRVKGHGNTGLLCGDLLALDLDIYEPGLAKQIEALATAMLPPTSMIRIGQSPKSLRCYRNDAPRAKRETPELFLPDGSKNQVEAMGVGQQIVGFGVHPATGQPYRWVFGDPAETAFDTLPIVTKPELDAFLRAAEAVIRAAGGRTDNEIKAEKAAQEAAAKGAGTNNRHVPEAEARAKNKARDDAKAQGESFFKRVNRAALGDLDAWVRRLFPRAEKQKTGAWQVSSADLGRDYEEDLSIHPTGVQDFGPREGKSPCDLVMQFGGAPDVVAAATTLCEWMGRDPTTLGWTPPARRGPSVGAEDTAEWPEPFFANADGIWFKDPPSKAEPKGSIDFVCAPFVVVAETADEAGGSWGLLLRWQDRNDFPHEWAMPRRLLHLDGNQIASELEAEGLNVGTGKVAHELLKNLLGRITTPNRRRCVARTGWHQTDTGRVYVLPGGKTFGPGGAGIILQTDHVAKADATRPRGTLAEWQENVARYAIGNHRIGLFLSAAFAGPLLDVMTEQSGGLHLHGGSQTGKTTSLRVAASAWGLADTSGQIRTWRATSNGMEGVAAETCDALLTLDEISMVDPREAGEIVYSLTNESGKARAMRDGSAQARRTWRLIFLSTGEIPLSVKMGEQQGHASMAGQEVRMASLPADAGKGIGVFEELHGMATGAALAVHLRGATTTYYGTAARAFLDKLAHARATDSEGLRGIIEQTCKTFLDKTLPKDADGQVVSVARRFALIAAAGELARIFGILPWPENEAVRAAAAGLQAWITARGGNGAAEDAQAIGMVRRFIEQYEESRFSLLLPASARKATEPEVRTERQTINRVGFRRETEEGGEFLILPECWKSEVCKGLDPARAAAALHAAGFLDEGDGKNWAKKQRIPNLGPARFYTVRGAILQGDV